MRVQTSSRFLILCLVLAVAVSLAGAQESIADLSSRALEASVTVRVFRDGRPLASGSGFVIDPDGLVVTNYHVIAGSDRISVTLGGRTYRDVSIAAAHKGWDLAVLSIPGDSLPWVPLAAKDYAVRVGDSVVAIGDPQGLTGTVSTGIVSAKRSGREIGLSSFTEPLIQTTAAISEGSSGGPLLNAAGEVVGINSLTYVEGQSLNFAVPVALLWEVLERRTGEFAHPKGYFAAVLQWDAAVDLDLELWSPERNYLGDASWLGSSRDSTAGAQGEEWFIFDADFAHGRYLLSPYFFGPETDEDVPVSLTIYHPDGRREVFYETLSFFPPYDQWWAVEIDLDQEEVIVIDVFPTLDDFASYQHTPGEFAVMLEWKGNFDLDLEIFSEDFEYLHSAAQIGESPDIWHGDDGGEWFVFRRYSTADYSSGRYVVSAYFYGPYSEEPVMAVLTVFFPWGETAVFRETLYYQPPYDQWFAILVDVDAETIDVLDFFLD